MPTPDLTPSARPADAAALRALLERFGEPQTRTQFIVAMATYMGLVGNLAAKVTLPMAMSAYRRFEAENRTIFGDPDYAWDLTAAVVVADEYEVAHWSRELATAQARHADAE